MGKRLLNKSLPLIRQALEDPKVRNDLSSFDAPLQVKTYMAIAIMLVHRDEFLAEDNRVYGNLGETLKRLIGGTDYVTSELTDYSKTAGLHHSRRSVLGHGRGNSTGWEVILTPPAELMEIVAAISPWRLQQLAANPGASTAPTAAQVRGLEIFQGLITGESLDVLADVYRRLGTAINP